MSDLTWLDVVAVQNRQAVAELQQMEKLDLGESEAIALAEEIRDAI